MAQEVEHVLGKDEVAGSNPAISSKKRVDTLVSARFLSKEKPTDGFLFRQKIRVFPREGPAFQSRR